MPSPQQAQRTATTLLVGAIAGSALCVLTHSTPCQAHVALDTPRSGVTLAVGSRVSITWEDTILHEGIGYDLDLIGANVQIQASIVHDLPTDVHSYVWIVPDISCVGCYIMVTQVNRGQSYSDSALINIYGKPAREGSGGTGGSSSGAQAGASAMPHQGGGGSGGSAGNWAIAGGTSAVAGGTSSTSSGGTEPENGGGDSTSAGSAEAMSGRGPGKPAMNSLGGASVDSVGGSPAAGDGELDEPEESAGQSPAVSPSVAGCMVNFSVRPPSRVGVVAAILLFARGARRRRVARRS